MTPPEITRRGPGDKDRKGWRIRVVPNLYPITPAHEVIIFSPAHDRSLAKLDAVAAREVFAVMRERAAQNLQSGCRYVQVFVNHGRAAGASLDHPHGQLVGLEFVPPGVDDRLSRFAAASRDVVADAIDAARRTDNVVVDGAAVCWCPPASPFPFSVRCAVADAGPRFDEASDAQIEAIADGLRDVLQRLASLLGDPPYNVVVHTAPRDTVQPFHWWVDVLPRVTGVAGFEEGTALYVNPVPPEHAALALREVAR
jgi:UDPglucose--hexose-1-phosphate uridylyltransferase